MVQENCLNKKAIMIAGPTAVGKTEFSLLLAEKYNCEIISVDSMQIYKNLDIGTGKISEKEMRGIPHHLLNIISYKDSFSVYDFVERAKIVMNDIWQRKKIPLLVGGTGLYFNALINGLNFSDSDKSEEIRNKYIKILETNGEEYLHNLLKNVDEVSASKIFPKDTKRVIRALEIFELTGKTKTESIKKFKPEFDYFFIVLNNERKLLYEKINKRVDQMIESGLLNEVKSFLDAEKCQSMQAIGYKEMISFIKGEIDFDTCVNLIKQNSRHYAKRQLTYFRWIDCEKIWFDTLNDDLNGILSDIEKFVK